MTKPRIYMVIGTFLPLVGGAERQALLQAQNLRQRGYDTTIITFRHQSDWPAHEEIEGVPVQRIAGRVLADRAGFLAPLRKLAYMSGMVTLGWTLWHLRRHYDVLHVHQLNIIVLPAAFACLLAHKPMVTVVCSAGTYKGGMPSQAASVLGTRHRFLASGLESRRPNPKDGDLADLWRLGGLAVEATRSLLRRIHAMVIVLSSRTRDYVTAYDFEMPDTRLIPNGVDTTRFVPNSLTGIIGIDASNVVCIARLNKAKGIDVLLRAWAKIAVSDSHARLLIAGSGPEEESLKDLAALLQITGSVTFLGLQNNVENLLQKAAIAVLPSRWEGLPNALLEAMACGLPCVATRVSGSEDIIEDGVNGLLVEPEDADGLASSLLLFLRDPDLSRRCGQAARETVEKHYDVAHITDLFVNIYQELHARLTGAGSS